MKLDFSKLNQITRQTAKIDPTGLLESEEGNLALAPEKPATGEDSHASGSNESPKYYKLEREKEEREKMREAFREYQRNIQRAGDLREQIAKGLNKGEDPIILLLKAMECISLMTGDRAIYNHSRQRIRSIYKRGSDPEE